jgi:dihydroneopterin aldolase
VDRLVLRGMAFTGRHGARPAERELPSRFRVDVELEADLRQAGASDDLRDTIDYTQAHALVRQVVEGEPVNLLETLAERIASRLLGLERVRSAVVRVAKRPPVDGEFASFEVEVRRP